MYKILLSIFILLWPMISYALNFALPKSGDDLVGNPKTTQVKSGENFSAVAIRFDVGYYEIFEANPGINPDNPAVNTVLIVPTQYILPLDLKKNTIVINLAEMRLYYLSRDNNQVYIFPVGIGKEDWETPVGERTIVKKVKNPSWVVPKSIYEFRKSIGDKVEKVIPPGPDNPMGKHALFLSGPGYMRIHGTNLPTGVGRRTSAGCIRLYENDIEQLFNMVDIGTKVVIVNQPYKAGWLGKKLYLEAHMPLFEQRLAMGDDIKPALDVIANSVKQRNNVVINWKKAAMVAREHLTVPRAIN